MRTIVDFLKRLMPGLVALVLLALAPLVAGAQVIDLRQPWLVVATLPATCTYARPLVFVTTAGPDFGLHQCNAGTLEPVGSGGGTPGGADTSIQFNDGGSFGGFGSWDGENLAVSAAVAGGTGGMFYLNTSATANAAARLSAITTGDAATGAASVALTVHEGGANIAELLIALAGDSGNNTPDTTFSFPGNAIYDATNFIQTFRVLDGTLEVGNDGGLYFELRTPGDVFSVSAQLSTLTDANVEPVTLGLNVHAVETNAAQFSISLAGDSGNNTPATTFTFPGAALFTGSTDGYTFDSDIIFASAQLPSTTVSFNNGAAAAIGTLTNAPTAGNPTKWIPINDNGTTRYIPAW